MGNSSDGDLNLMKDVYRLRIKTTLAMLKKMSFEEFLKEHIKIGPGISPGELFQNAIWDCLLAVEHAIKKKDAELLAKAKNVCEAGLTIPGITITFEFKYFLNAFKERVIKKIFVADKRDIKEFYNSITHYSDN